MAVGEEVAGFAGEMALAAVMAPYLASFLVLLLHRADWRVVAWTGVAGLVVSAIASLLAFMTGLHHGGEYIVGWAPSFGITFSLRLDFLSLMMGLIVSWLSLLIGIYSVEYIGSWGAARYWFFFTFFVGSMMLLVMANDLYALLIGWEGTGLASYALISFYYDDRESDWVGDPGRRALGVPMWSPPTHSGIRAIVFTRLADAAMLAAVGLVHALAGTTHLAVLGDQEAFVTVFKVISGYGVFVPFLVAFYVGALAKSAQLPFHEWLVTAMTGPAPVSALIHAATMVKAGVYFALRFTPWIIAASATTGLIGAAGSVFNWFLWLALLTAFALATMAIVARELKLILAYSTASQLSYMFAAVFAAAVVAAATDVHEVFMGVYAGLSHLLSHAVFKAALFLAAGALIHAVHSRYITDMGGLRKTMPYTFVAFLLAGLSLAAIPPFSGWWSKDAVVHVVSEAGLFAAAAALVTAVLTAAYTLRTIVYVFTTKPLGREAHGHEPGWLMLGPYLVLGLASIGLGLAWVIVEELLAEGFKVHPGLDITMALVGTAAAVVGAALGSIYLFGVKPWKAVEASTVLRALHGFLYDRWYINAIIYRIIVYPGDALARKLRDVFERGIDDWYHILLPEMAVSLGATVRRAQTGSLVLYMAYFALGLLAVTLLSFYIMWG